MLGRGPRGVVRRTFAVPDGFPANRVELRCDGLDAYASVWLDGAFVGCHANQFVPTVFDVGPYLRPGEKESSALKAAATIRLRV